MGTAARAQTPEPSAAELTERANRARDAGRLDEAIEGFARAYQMSGEIGLLFSLGDAYHQAGHLEEALRVYQTYVRRDPTGPNRDTADRVIRELERQIETAKKSAPATAPPKVTPPPPPAPAPPVAPSSTAAPTVTAPGADLTAPGPAAAPVDSAGPPLPRWLPWALTVATVGLGAGAIVSGLSASNRYDELHDSCGKVAGGCGTADIDDVKKRARRANILWALTSAAAVGAGVTIIVNVNAAGASGLWSF